MAPSAAAVKEYTVASQTRQVPYSFKATCLNPDCAMHLNVRAGKDDASYRLDNFVRAGLGQCARFTQPILMIAFVRAFATFINRDNRLAF